MMVADYDVRQAKIRLAGPPPKTQIGKLQRQIDKSRVEGPKKSARDVSNIHIPTNTQTTEKFIRLAERDLAGFNSLKTKDEYFGFTIAGNESRTVFKDISEAINLLNEYLKKGSGVNAQFGIFKTTSASAWREKAGKPIAVVGTPKGLSRAKKAFLERKRENQRKAGYKGRTF
jgi:hypothetical protein